MLSLLAILAIGYIKDLKTIHKYKYTNTNTQTQIHKYKYTNSNTQIQIHKQHLYTSFPFSITVTLPSIFPGVFRVT